VAGEGDNVLTTVENLAGGDANDTLVGSAANNVLVGRDGNDDLTGGGHADLLIGGWGADRIHAFDGVADTIYCDSLDSGDRDRNDKVAGSCPSVKPALTAPTIMIGGLLDITP
jgi:Ca2+-binding RTX toxin-like protein